jgi:prepilin-type N-terminal cleavage/methylation domain-containing protein/prepilin-type processing-associated H-X9-DG protein
MKSTYDNIVRGNGVGTESRHASRVGFTLVELLVVIGVIAVLIAILLPTLSKARSQAQEVQCQSNIRQLVLGMRMYCDTFQGYVPEQGPDGSNRTTNFFGPSGGVIGINDPSLWFNAVGLYSVNKSYYDMLVADYQGITPLPSPTGGANNVFACPTQEMPYSYSAKDKVSPDGNFFLVNGKDSQGVLPTSVSAPTMKMYLSYVLNSMPFGAPSPSPGNPSPRAITSVRITQLSPASIVPIIVERLMNPSEYADKDIQALASRYPSSIGKNIQTPTHSVSGVPAGVYGYGNNIAQPAVNWKRFAARHRGGGYIGFVDGHVAWYKWGQTQWQQPVEPAPAMYNVNQPANMVWEPFGWIN